ncbi:MAG: TolC family protein [Alcaligenaceae bacterium]|nr:TolC family protein [Alcaligenaceae bacterium]
MNYFNFKLSTILLSSALLVACSGTQMNLQSEVELPVAFEQYQGDALVELDRWWLSWNDPELTRLIDMALSNNKELAATRARLEEARAMARAARANMGPEVGASANAMGMNTRLRNPVDDRMRNVLGAMGSDLGDKYLTADGMGLSGGIAASWEPDFFGHKQADVDAATQGAIARAEQWHAAQMLLSTDIADYYSQWLYFGEKQALTAQQIQHLQDLLRYANGRFNAGQATAYDVLKIETQIQAATAARVMLEAQKANAERRLAVLTAQVPQHFKLSPSKRRLANQTPPMPRGQTPANVLNRRPDIRANQALVYAASAQLASARADLLPRFKINFLGQGGVVSLDSDMPNMGGLSNLISVGVQLPIFTAGRIQANIDSKDAKLQAALLDYDHSVLSALADVDSAYQAQYHLRAQENQFQQALNSSRQQVGASEKLFKYGEATLDRTLEARLQLNELQTQLLDLNLAKSQAMLNLYKALGGGWQADETKAQTESGLLNDGAFTPTTRSTDS